MFIHSTCPVNRHTHLGPAIKFNKENCLSMHTAILLTIGFLQQAHIKPHNLQHHVLAINIYMGVFLWCSLEILNLN